MKKKLFTGLCVGIMCCTMISVAACGNDDKKTPEKLQDGYQIVLEEGNSATVDLSLYISVADTDYTYSVESSAQTVATVTLSENIATVTAVSAGTATVTASAGDVSVEFPVTVNAKEIPQEVDKSELQAEVDGALTERGDYTEPSFNAYNVRLGVAKSVLANADATQAQVDNALKDLKAAYEALVLRAPSEVVGCVKEFELLSGTEREINLSEYVNDENLSKITYAVTADGNLVTVGEVEEGKVTLTAANAENDAQVAVTIKVLYDGAEKLSVVLTVNVLKVADKTELQAEVDNAVTSQGDYTAESYDTYSLKLEAAKAVLENTAVTQTQVNNALEELQAAREALELRVPAEVDGAVKAFNILSGGQKEITLSDYVDDKNLSKITYGVICADQLITAGDVAGGKVTLTAASTDEDREVSVTLKVMYDGEEKLSVVLTVTVLSEPKPVLKQDAVTKSIDVYSLEDKTKITLDFTENVDNAYDVALEYEAALDGQKLTLTDDNAYAYTLGNAYSEEPQSVAFEVTVKYGNGKSLTYTYTLNICDTTAYRAANGDFENGLDGWTMTGDIGVISEDEYYWETRPILNVGKYFRGESKQNNAGTLASPYFTVGGLNKITFKLGAAGNKDCYVTLEKEDGTLLAIWRNTQFKDPDCALTLVDYVADLSAYNGQRVRLVLNDNNGGFGFFTFDELITYYTDADQLPADAVSAVDELADKTALKAAISGALTEQGDYTTESFDVYTAKVGEARAISEKVSATQQEVDAAVSAVQAAFEALELRSPLEVANADKAFKLLIGVSRELNISDYIDGNGLSSLTYKAVSDNDLLEVGEIVDGKATVTAGTVSEETEVGLKLIAEYKGETVLTVSITVTLTNQVAPVIKENAVEIVKDLYTETNKTDITIDIASNVENPGNLTLGYEVTLGGAPVTLDGAKFTHTYGSLTETVTETVYNVKVTYTLNDNSEELNFTYTLKLKDTTKYRVVNGGFDNGLDGWTMTGDIGVISEDEYYWGTHHVLNVGKYFRGESKEGNTGTLASPYFTVGGLNKITFMLGAASNENCYVTLEKEDGTVLAIWRNLMFSDPDCALTLTNYLADLSEYSGEKVRLVLNDNATSGFAFFTFDELVTYYVSADELPKGTVVVVNELADKSALEAVLQNVISDQGDYTAESFDDYKAKVEAGRAVLADRGVRQSAVDSAKTAIENAYNALTLRSIEVVQDAETSFVLVSEGEKSIDFENYIDVKNLSSLTYDVTSDNALVTVEKIADGKYKLTAAVYAQADPATVKVTLSVRYKDNQAVTVELNITVKSDAVPVLKQDAVTRSIDIYALENKENITLNFAENVDSQGVALVYGVTLNNSAVEIDNNNCLVYDLTEGAYDETETPLVFGVTVTYGDGETLEYTYTLNVKDTTKYRVVNGGFETGDLSGWTILTEGMTGGVIDAQTWWNEQGPYNKTGVYHLDGWNTGIAEGDTWAIRSSAFTLGGTGYISVRMGGHAAAVKVYKANGELIGEYRQNHFSDTNFPLVGDGEGKGSWADMRKYFIDLRGHEGEELYVELCDIQVDGWAHAFFDELETYYPELPDIENGYDTVRVPVSKDPLAWDTAQLKWRLAEKI